jgi:hypothetical protein
MKILFLIFMLLDNPIKDNTLRESTDLIELNHQYGKKGEHVFDQIIFWEILPETRKLKVRAWTLADYDNSHKRFALKKLDNIYTVTYFDQDVRAERKITSRIFRESWTHEDPERENKKLYNENTRTGLIKPPKPKPNPPTVVEPL